MTGETFFFKIVHVRYEKLKILCCYKKCEYPLGQNAPLPQNNFKLKAAFKVKNLASPIFSSL